MGARVSQGGKKIGRMRSSLLLGGVHEMKAEELFCIEKGKLCITDYSCLHLLTFQGRKNFECSLTKLSMQKDEDY